VRRLALSSVLMLVTACADVSHEAEEKEVFPCSGLPVCARELNVLNDAEQSMKLAYSRVIQTLKSCEPNNSTKCYNMPRAIKLIETEQRTWLDWRDAHCDVSTFGMEETSAEGELRADCRRRLTLNRTAELQKIRDE
jgi:uncharacterized protein YecT (DUF1311 family)